jgi:muconolactone D-isomerase
MEFLVQIEARLPPETDEATRTSLAAQELKRGRQLRADGVIQRIWRLPGSRSNAGIWEAEDATALHAAIASLPLFPWLDVRVTPLAQHPVETP